jgi:hypothetical protein
MFTFCRDQVLCGFDKSNVRGDAEGSTTPSLAELLKQLEEQRGAPLFMAEDTQVQTENHIQEEKKAFNDNNIEHVASADVCSEQGEDELTNKSLPGVTMINKNEKGACNASGF